MVFCASIYSDITLSMKMTLADSSKNVLVPGALEPLMFEVESYINAEKP